MADPFEVRMRFTSQLQHLNASTASATKAANYAIKYYEFSDDLHSCILEQLERNNMNNRANIMYFLPALCDMAKAQGQLAYVRMMERDILRIIDLVAPDDGSGAANIKVVRKVLEQLQQKSFLNSQAVAELHECIAGREALGEMDTSPVRDAESAAPQRSHVSTASNTTVRSTPQPNSRDALHPTGLRLDKRQIEQRIEEDRERHKRAREGIWAIPQGKNGPAEDAEFSKLWEEVSDIDDDDYIVAGEETQERRRRLEYEGT